MLKACSKCGKIHSYDFKCNGGSGRLPETNEQALRRGSKWTAKSRDIREKSNYICAVCRELREINPSDAVEVHHIRKLRDYPEGLLEDENLICLCVFHHKQADAGEIDAEHLKKLAQERENRFTSLL